MLEVGVFSVFFLLCFAALWGWFASKLDQVEKTTDFLQLQIKTTQMENRVQEQLIDGCIDKSRVSLPVRYDDGSMGSQVFPMSMVIDMLMRNKIITIHDEYVIQDKEE